MKGKDYWKAREWAAQVIVFILALIACYYAVAKTIEVLKTLLKGF